MLDALDHAVGGALDDADIFARKADALMVGAVDGKILPVKACKKRILLCMGRMKLVTLFIAVGFCLRQMFPKPAPEKNVDQLHPLADSEDGTAVLCKQRKQGELLFVQSRIDAAPVWKERRISAALIGQERRVDAVPIRQERRGDAAPVRQEHRINVAPAGQDQTVPAFRGIGI